MFIQKQSEQKLPKAFLAKAFPERGSTHAEKTVEQNTLQQNSAILGNVEHIIEETRRHSAELKQAVNEMQTAIVQFDETAKDYISTSKKHSA